MLDRFWRSYKKAKDANSHYSVLNNAYLTIIWTIGAAGTTGSLMSFVLSQIASFWNAYGLAGAIAMGIATALLVALLGALIALISIIGHNPATAVFPAVQPETKAAVPAEANAIDRITRTAIVTAGTNAWPPQYRVEFAKSGRSVEIYLRFNVFAGGFRGGGWTAPVTVKLRDVDRYLKDESLTIPIAYSVETHEGLRWAFGSQPDLSENGFPTHMLGPNRHYRGAVIVIGPGETEEFCFFVAEATSMETMPQIVGEHMWNHIYEWGDRRPPNGDPSRLYR